MFDSSKVTDHHAIIPTGVAARQLGAQESVVYDEVCRRFIAVFYPDCQFATTTVLGKMESVAFKTTGKQLLQPGWRELYAQTKNEPSEGETDEEAKLLPQFVKGESGPHRPQLAGKQTTPPKPYTEATLLRAMETAGKLVEDETLREALKENGIGRPSTRAAIIETLFKRQYIRKERKSLQPTQTGVELIGLIHDELLKSAELTGIWEKKLREIEQHKYEARQFLDELKQMVTEIVTSVMLDNSNRRVSTVVPEAKPKKTAPKKSTTSKAKKTTEGIYSSQRTNPRGNDMPSEQKKPSEGMSFQHKAVGERESMPSDTNPDAIIGQPCPLCGKGHIIKGKTAYGCSEWRNGCGWRKAF